ncbi:MAG TPA: glycosyltransferase family 4 protein [Mycobacterium sp.]
MSDQPVRSVLMLCWRDTGHPQGGGSETYLQRIGAQLAQSGVAVTLRTARYPGAPRRGVIDGVRISRGGGPYSVYIWAGLAMVLARIGLGPLRHARPDLVIDAQNGIPFLARLAYGRRVVVLVHHCHREQWPVAGRWTGRFGWFVESRLSPWLHRRNQYVTVSLPSMRDLAALGVAQSRIAVVRNGLDAAPEITLTAARSAVPRVAVLSRLVPHKQIEDALDAIAMLADRIPGLHLDIVGGGWWHDRLVAHAELLGISSAVTFHGHVDDVTKHQVVQRSWVHLLPSRKEGWGLAVVEAAQHSVPTIGYRSSGGLTDSIVDGVTGILVDDSRELADRLEELLGDEVLREELGRKAQARIAEFSWQQSAHAMRGVLEVVWSGRRVSGLR